MPDSVQILAHSKNAETGDELLTFELEYWRAIHAEVMTHRVFSRNAASSRAVPVRKTLARVWSDMAGPVHWGANQKGMQAKGELTGLRKWTARKLWWLGGVGAISIAAGMNLVGLHKQVANRVLEPWSRIRVVLSGTQWKNFYRLRVHPDAMPEFQQLAAAMLELHQESKPKLLNPGQWHMPYRPYEDTRLNDEHLLKICTARVARVSYFNFDDRSVDYKKDFDLHDRLMVSGHWSPFEHCAQALDYRDTATQMGESNFRGYMQYRKLFQGENRDDGVPGVDEIAEELFRGVRHAA